MHSRASLGPEGSINMAADIRGIADEVFATIGTGHQIAPFTKRPGGLSLGEAYRVTALSQSKARSTWRETPGAEDRIY